MKHTLGSVIDSNYSRGVVRLKKAISDHLSLGADEEGSGEDKPARSRKAAPAKGNGKKPRSRVKSKKVVQCKYDGCEKPSVGGPRNRFTCTDHHGKLSAPVVRARKTEATAEGVAST